MPEPEPQQLPGAQVTPALPAASDDTVDISAPSANPRWTGSAAVPPPGTPRRRGALDRDDTHDLPMPDYDDEPGPSLRERWRAWRRTPAAVAPPAAQPPTPTRPPAPPTRPPAQAPAYGPPAGHGQAYDPPAGHGQAYGPPAGHGPGYGPAGRGGHGQRPPAGYGPPPQWRGPQPGYGPPAGHGTPQPVQRGYGPPPPPRPRRRYPWKTTLFLLAVLACCGGCLGWAKPFWDEYPASIAADAAVAGYSVSTDAARAKAADELLGQIESDQVDEKSTTVLYTDERQRGATLVATTRFVFDPEKDLTARFGSLAGRLNLTDARAVDAGSLGGYQRCAAGTYNGRPAAVCGWADHGSLALVVFSGRSIDDAAGQLTTIRGAVLQRG